MTKDRVSDGPLTNPDEDSDMILALRWSPSVYSYSERVNQLSIRLTVAVLA